MLLMEPPEFFHRLFPCQQCDQTGRFSGRQLDHIVPRHESPSIPSVSNPIDEMSITQQSGGEAMPVAAGGRPGAALVKSTFYSACYNVRGDLYTIPYAEPDGLRNALRLRNNWLL